MCMCGKKKYPLSYHIYRAPAAALAEALAARWNRERRSTFSVRHRLCAFEIYKLRLAGNNFLHLQEPISFLPAKRPLTLIFIRKRLIIDDFLKIYLLNCRTSGRRA